MKNTIVKSFIKLKSAIGVQAWVLESAFVLTILIATALLSGKGWVEYIAVGAVYLTFKHASVSERLREANEANAKTATAETTSCAHKLQQFFYGKEAAWVLYFLLIGAYSALAGCGIFFLYGWWRKIYREIHPRETTVSRAKSSNRLFYRHFKYADTDGINGCYELLSLGEFTESGERMAVYRPLYKLPNLWEEGIEVLIRTEKNFNEYEDRMNGNPRFRIIEDQDTIVACIEATNNLYA